MTDAEHAQRRKWIALALLATTQFVIVLDAAIVNVAIPSIGRDLDFSAGEPRLDPQRLRADVRRLPAARRAHGRPARPPPPVHGGPRRLRRRVAAGRLLGDRGAAHRLARALQGLGAALLAPSALSMVTNMFAEGAERNKALGVWGAVSGSGGAAGVLLGGVLTEYAGWEWVLWVNVPIVIIAALLAPRLLVESRGRGRDAPLRRARRGRHHRRPVAARLRARRHRQRRLGLDADARRCSRSRSRSSSCSSSIERRSVAPLVPFRIFRLRTLTGANVIGLLLGAALFSMFFFLSRYMQEVLGYSALKAGLSYLPLALVDHRVGGHRVACSSRSSASSRCSSRGSCSSRSALLWFAQLPIDGVLPRATSLAPMVLAAVGLGFAFVPVTIAAVSGISPDDSGLASGLINTSQQIGGALGLAVLATIANTAHGGPHRRPRRATRRRCRAR